MFASNYLLYEDQDNAKVSLKEDGTFVNLDKLFVTAPDTNARLESARMWIREAASAISESALSTAWKTPEGEHTDELVFTRSADGIDPSAALRNNVLLSSKLLQEIKSAIERDETMVESEQLQLTVEATPSGSVSVDETKVSGDPDVAFEIMRARGVGRDTVAVSWENLEIQSRHVSVFNTQSGTMLRRFDIVQEDGVNYFGEHWAGHAFFRHFCVYARVAPPAGSVYLDVVNCHTGLVTTTMVISTGTEVNDVYVTCMTCVDSTDEMTVCVQYADDNVEVGHHLVLVAYKYRQETDLVSNTVVDTITQSLQREITAPDSFALNMHSWLTYDGYWYMTDFEFLFRFRTGHGVTDLDQIQRLPISEYSSNHRLYRNGAKLYLSDWADTYWASYFSSIDWLGTEDASVEVMPFSDMGRSPTMDSAILAALTDAGLDVENHAGYGFSNIVPLGHLGPHMSVLAQVQYTHAAGEGEDEPTRSDELYVLMRQVSEDMYDSFEFVRTVRHRTEGIDNFGVGGGILKHRGDGSPTWEDSESGKIYFYDQSPVRAFLSADLRGPRAVVTVQRAPVTTRTNSSALATSLGFFFIGSFAAVAISLYA